MRCFRIAHFVEHLGIQPVRAGNGLDRVHFVTDTEYRLTLEFYRNRAPSDDLRRIDR